MSAKNKGGHRHSDARGGNPTTSAFVRRLGVFRLLQHGHTNPLSDSSALCNKHTGIRRLNGKAYCEARTCLPSRDQHFDQSHGAGASMALRAWEARDGPTRLSRRALLEELWAVSASRCRPHVARSRERAGLHPLSSASARRCDHRSLAPWLARTQESRQTQLPRQSAFPRPPNRRRAPRKMRERTGSTDLLRGS